MTEVMHTQPTRDNAAGEQPHDGRSKHPTASLGQVLVTRRFWPLFVTQFLGAVNDNLFKQAITLLILYRLATDEAIGGLFVVAGTALFILPYLMFSVLAGQLADRFDKAKITRVLKVTEIGAALIGILGLVTASPFILLLALFLFGLQSTLFSPSKYAMLPQHLRQEELLAGNALLESGGVLAIIAGLIGGGLMFLTPSPTLAIGIATITIGVAGLVASLFIPASPPPYGVTTPALDGWKPQAIWEQL